MRQIPIFVINMARETERMKSVATELERAGLTFERFEAIDGRKVSAEERLNIYSDRWYRMMHGCSIPPGEFGCVLSHRAIYQRMIDENISCALILEDDVIFQPDLAKRLVEIENTTQDFDMMQLFSFRRPDRFVRKSQSSELEIRKFKNLHASTAAYMMRLTGAKKLMRISKVRTNPDRWCWQSAMTGLKCCGVLPMPIVLHETFSADSTLTRINGEVERSANQNKSRPHIWRFLVLPWLNLVKLGILRARGL